MTGKLMLGEAHPASFMAREWITKLPPEEIALWQEAFASVALAGHNRLAEVCSETFRRLLAGEPMSDRYVLGLAWAMAHSGRR